MILEATASNLRWGRILGCVGWLDEHLVHDGNTSVVVEGVWLRHPSCGWKLSELSYEAMSSIRVYWC